MRMVLLYVERGLVIILAVVALLLAVVSFRGTLSPGSGVHIYMAICKSKIYNTELGHLVTFCIFNSEWSKQRTEIV